MACAAELVSVNATGKSYHAWAELGGCEEVPFESLMLKALAEK
jgi:hypothetical protein